MKLGKVGIWSHYLRVTGPGDRGEIEDAVAELDELGYSALWLPGHAAADDFVNAGAALSASTRLTVATGILNIWLHEPAATAAGFADLEARHPGRFLLGLGVSHAEHVADRGYLRPYSAMRRYLEELDPAVPRERRVLAALGPRMLRLAAERAAGCHPFLVSVEHTRRAREVLGEGPLLAPEVKVVLDPDRDAARAVARRHLSRFLDRPNYVNNLLRLGFTEDDLRDGGSDRLIEATFACGDVQAAVARAREHLAVGADHVALHVAAGDLRGPMPREQWRLLAKALL
ncbi:putative F420-dependent oxidoreductase [Thermocatellispora tengchongensis]|uniref:Putative F420-dependent oxidoreductase n=1 Tax=Thermocatellispora tengchongensis TaxID=1073253 RepID=A0A840PMI9_9ACTN|nr:LLM class F420-dependent oxidoreductase [Thermocatellispora tengchongensis]MBB5140116.1 putative F420-dependent oxidoreductase [Thermocatellispora tengchongensis]